MWATLLFIATPAFVVNGNSLETDVVFLAFWMASVALFVGGRYGAAVGGLAEVGDGRGAHILRALALIPTVTAVGALGGGLYGTLGGGLYDLIHWQAGRLSAWGLWLTVAGAADRVVG